MAALFTDIHMPGMMDGMDLARTVHERWSHVVPVVTSGRMRLRDSDIPVGGRFIDKPYHFSEVTGIIRDALG